jgi:hypothetical protein
MLNKLNGCRSLLCYSFAGLIIFDKKTPTISKRTYNPFLSLIYCICCQIDVLKTTGRYCLKLN